MFRLLICATALLGASASAEPLPTPQDFESRVTTDDLYGSIGWHLDRTEAEKPGALIVWLAGSGAMPHFQSFTDGSVGFDFPPQLLAHRNEAHFLLIDKPGIPFTAEMQFDEQRQRPVELDNPAYRAGLTKDNLVARAAIAIRAAREELGTRATSLVIIGGSEGGQYAFALARQVKADRVAVWGGIALPHYYDLVVELRLKAERGEMTRAEAQQQIERLHASIRAVQDDPLDTVQRFYGETHRRWSGLGPYSAVEDMLSLEVPLLMVQGGADTNAPILNSDYAMIAFLSQGRTNLTYWVYPDLDHFFQDVATDPSSPERDRAGEVWTRIWQWVSAED